jgi:hypothetical protein
MSRLYFSLIAFFICNSLMAQIEKLKPLDVTKIGEIKSVGVLIAKLEYTLSGSDTTYILTYNNLKYNTTDIRSFKFKETGGVLNAFYEYINNAISKNEKTDIVLGDEAMILRPQRTMGIKHCDIMLTGGDYFTLTKKNLDKLFNKK